MSYQSEVLADAPVLYLTLNEASGASCADLSGNGFTGTARGTFTRGVSLGNGFSGVGPGVTLGGTSSDLIDVPQQATLDITGAVTYECWFIPTNLGSITSGSIMSKGYLSTSTDQGFMLSLITTGSTANKALVNFGGAFSGGTITASPVNQVQNSTLYYLVCTRTAGNVCTTYVNATQVDQRTSSPTVGASSQKFAIGGRYGAGTNGLPIAGTVASVAVYNTALSQARVTAHYAARDIPAAGAVSSFSDFLGVC